LQPSDIQQLIAEYKAGNLSSVVEQTDAYIKRFPNTLILLNIRGAALLDLGHLNEAVECFQKALKIEPSSAEGHNNLGLALQRSGNYNSAAASYREAIILNPRLADAHNNLGLLLSSLGQTKEAIESYKTALTNAPKNPAIHNNLGIVFKELGDLIEATKCYRRALELASNYKDARINLAVVLVEQEHFDEAIQCFLKVDPTVENTKISALLLECYYRKGDRKAYEIQLQLIKSQQTDYNFRAGAVAAFVSHQHDTKNIYQFYNDPIEKVTTFNALDDRIIDQHFINNLYTATNKFSGNEHYSPGHISAGYQSAGNLFELDVLVFAKLETIIRRYIDQYFAKIKNDKSLFVNNWPKDYLINGWYIRLMKGGEISAHIHSGWLSGVFYLKVPNKMGGNEGNIEYTLCGYDLPVKNDGYPRKIIETKPGTLVLFPSSLPHRVFPFTSDEERICLAFDIIPK